MAQYGEMEDGKQVRGLSTKINLPIPGSAWDLTRLHEPLQVTLYLRTVKQQIISRHLVREYLRIEGHLWSITTLLRQRPLMRNCFWIDERQ